MRKNVQKAIAAFLAGKTIKRRYVASRFGGDTVIPISVRDGVIYSYDLPIFKRLSNGLLWLYEAPIGKRLRGDDWDKSQAKKGLSATTKSQLDAISYHFGMPQYRRVFRWDATQAIGDERLLRSDDPDAFTVAENDGGMCGHGVADPDGATSNHCAGNPDLMWACYLDYCARRDARLAQEAEDARIARKVAGIAKGRATRAANRDLAAAAE